MQLIKISLIAAAVLSGFAFAGLSDIDDIPGECKVRCASIKRIGRTCRFTHIGNKNEVSCICNAPDAQEFTESCSKCVEPLWQEAKEHDITQIKKACNWGTKPQPTPTSSVPAFTNWPKATGLGPLPGRRPS
ncbi:uncharacterized protein L3040_001574 [Drepanopeziza brunnea f. sp. 'multigermtubi']|uniref:Uncharacterized protein n=1 Tax=Marssonina brunnea f. sp. multigermtubi (strain MB_m1) TaxID=1072389 RepID=K1WCW7_MARBU|nr:uncharacterized protein MBM_06421 [Drepanopeziza brunnea f. sp. 'multigermtubi' MB_m1]EKD15205.1 hypothetical protein MBM_06421 [Drepanopeziza brunnea f. sp. 'multigermtubi' MB_m1]KAJ5051803.1 hypothetical protein L3040_001574 [Drepanopeziza brunnea f. sp. 'multigermtubi']